MKRGGVLAAVVVASLWFAGSALAGVPDGLGPWADYVVAHNQGCAYVSPDLTTCRAVRPDRSDPQAAVGPAETPHAGDNNPIPAGTFYSLGFTAPEKGTAFITLGFDNPVCNGVGNDLAIDLFEITKEPYPPEKVNVFVSQDNVNYVFAGTVTKDGTVGVPAQFQFVNFVKIVDVTDKTLFIGQTPDIDAYDLDGVKSLQPATVCSPLTGTIEICKSGANGMSGRSFQFSLNNGALFTVRGGRCTGPITTIVGANRVVELLSNPPTDVADITVRPSSRLLIKDLPNRTAIVFVQPGSTAANETMVTFVNQPAGGTVGDLKICKLSQSPAYWGDLFSFHVNGGPLISTQANDASADPSTWSCRIVGTFQTGSRVTVTEALPAGAEVEFFDTDPPQALIDFSTTTASATVQIIGPVTTLLVDNEPIPPPQSGYIEICKNADLVGGRPDPFVTGPFTFTVAPSDGNSFDVTTLAGQCTQAFQIAAGVTRVTEQASPNTTLVDTSVSPGDRFLAQNPINRTVDVEVPVSSSSNNETQVTFVNRHDRSQLKLCKALGTASDALIGQTFTFTVTSPGVPTVTPSLTAPICVVIGDYPVGNTVTVTENLDHSVGAPGQFIETTGEGTTTIQPGTTNTVTVTNTAKGQIEICKTRITYLTGTQPTFTFRLDGMLVSVQAGKCSTGRLVTPGPHTVSEIASNDYDLVGISTIPAGRLTSSDLNTRTAVVDVPYGGNGGGDTPVSFTNAVKTGQVKVCKNIPSGSTNLAGKTFSYSIYTQAPGYLGYTVQQTGAIFPGECTLVTDPIPVLQPNGKNTAIGIHENEVTGTQLFAVTNIALTSGTRGYCTTVNSPGNVVCPYTTGFNYPTGDVDFFLGPNVNQIDYTNTAT